MHCYISCYLRQLKNGLEIISGAFSAHFFYEKFLYIILYQLIKFQYQSIFTSQDIKQLEFIQVSVSEHLHFSRY